MSAQEIETVDAELVTAETARAELEAARPAVPPAALAAGVAATGFAAGVVTVAAARRRKLRKLGKRRSKGLGKIVSSRSFLVDVHLLDR